MTAFARYIGIDYSGAQTPNASLKGLRVYQIDGRVSPIEVAPPPSPRKYWTRRGLAEWLVTLLAEDTPTLVGIDHGFSFPLRYFETHCLKPDWPEFLDDFQSHWPTDEDIYVDFVRDGIRGNGATRMGNARWKRLTEVRAGGAKSVFHFDVQGSVAKSTHAGIPWLRFIRQKLAAKVHFWPFDGWEIPTGRSAIAEVYPALWSRGFAREERNSDQHDAYSVLRVPGNEAFGMGMPFKTKGLDIAIAKDVRKRDLAIQKEVTLSLGDRGVSFFRDWNLGHFTIASFANAARFQHGINCTLGEEIDARLRNHRGPMFELKRDGVQQCQSSPVVLDFEGDGWIDTVTGASWVVIHREMIETACDIGIHYDGIQKWRFEVVQRFFSDVGSLLSSAGSDDGPNGKWNVHKYQNTSKNSNPSVPGYPPKVLWLASGLFALNEIVAWSCFFWLPDVDVRYARKRKISSDASILTFSATHIARLSAKTLIQC